MLTNYFGDMSYFSQENEGKVYVNQDESLTDLQILIKYSFRLNFLHECLMNLIIISIVHVSCSSNYYIKLQIKC